MRIIITTFALLFSLISYADDYQDGIKHYRNGDLADAIDSFSKCTDINVYCNFNLGISYLDRGQAVEGYKWINESARYGVPQSINLLKKSGLPVPEADLAHLWRKKSVEQNNPVSGNEYKSNKEYKSSVGNTYEYDLSKPLDSIRYETDHKAQMRDSLDVDPMREIERDLGQFGGGRTKRK